MEPEQISPILKNVEQTATWQTNRIEQTATWLTQYSDRLLSFLLNSQLHTLSTPNNLQLWGSAALWEIGQCNLWAYYGRLSVGFKC